MITNSSVWNEQKPGWRSLKGLHPTAIHLERISFIREKSPEYLARAANLETLLLDLGLNDEGIDEFPASLHPFCGSGPAHLAVSIAIQQVSRPRFWFERVRTT